MTKHGLGRIHSFDPRDRGYLLPRPTKMSAVQSKIWDVAGPPLDQGETPMCVGYGTAKWIQASPIVNPMPDPVEMYHAAQAYDEWPGTDYDGSSVRGAMKALKHYGVVGTYSWAATLLTCINYVLEKGPMLVGTNWYENMFEPRASGDLSVSGGVAGGHCYVLMGADQGHVNPNRSKGAFKMLNSWGDWGPLHGWAWIGFKSFGRLLNEDGEAAVATEILQTKPIVF